MSDSNKAVFLSYASQDAEAAKRMCEALRAAGIEVWFDQNELVGGDAWDQKIRGQVASCALFVPVVSAATQARREGYFRLEWKLADERTHLMAEGTPFLLPVVIDGTKDREALVPKSFLGVQWTWLPAGETNSAFVTRVQKLVGLTGTALPAAIPSHPAAIENAPAAKSGLLVWITLALGVAVLALVTYVLLRPATKESPAAAPPKPAVAEAKPTSVAPPVSGPAAPDPKAVAVLAFANLSSEKDSEYFSDGLSENISGKLARVPGLRMTASTSSFYYKGKNVPMQQIATELHVGTVIAGSVQRLGNSLRVVAQLINAADGMLVWSETYDEELTTAGIFAIQDKIALKIAGRLTPNNTAAVAVGERPTANLEAYDLYLRAHDLIVKNVNGNYAQVTKLLNAATELDPSFALAWAWTGWVGGRILTAGGPGVEMLVQPAERAIDEALRLQPDQPVAHLARAWLLNAEGNRLDELSREIDLAEGGRAPTAETLETRGRELLARGRPEAALDAYRRATELDPKNALTINSYGNALNVMGRYAEASVVFDRSIEMGGPSVSAGNKLIAAIRAGRGAAQVKAIYGSVPEDRWSPSSRETLSIYLQAVGLNAEALKVVQKTEPAEFLAQWGYFIRAASTARIREAMGDAEGALRDYREALTRAEAYRRDHSESWRIYVTLARIYQGLGQKDEALAAARKCLALVPPEKNPYFAARTGLRVLVNAQARFGQLDDALDIAREQIAKGWWRRNDLLLSPDWSELQKDPRFRALAEKAPL